MTNDQYGTYQTPSARPPEPPYRSSTRDASTSGGSHRRSNAQTTYDTTQRMYKEVDLSGFDTPGNTASMGGMDTASYTPPQATRQHVRSYTAPKQEAKPAGVVKTFVAGFLGALLACGIAFGAFTAWGQFNKTSTPASTVMGTTDSSVINAVEEGQTLAEAVAAKALPSVVAVYNYQQASTGGFGYGSTASNSLQPAGMGSGVLISDDGYILTNYHVVEGAQELKVKVGDEERAATYVGGDDSSDVAVIKIEDTSGMTPADIGDSDNLAIGEWVMTVGAPLGLEQSVATGVVSATNRSTIMSDSQSNGYTSYTNANPNYTYYPSMIQTDAVINPGNSGGALVDSDGKLIGINTMISSYSGDYAGVGFAIPVNYAMGIAKQVIDGKEPTHAILGVSVSSVNASNASRYGLATNSGAYVGAISDELGAAQAGIQVGDIITAIDGKTVTSATDVTLDVRAFNPGDTVTVTVNRNGETLDIPVVLSSDENLAPSQEEQNSQQGNSQADPYGRGQGRGQGGSGGYTDEQLEELLKMLGM